MIHTLLPSSTSVVTREPHFIRKVHPPSMDIIDGQKIAALASLLHKENIAIPQLLSYVDRSKVSQTSENLITYWKDVGDNCGIDWRAAGMELKKVHTIPLEKVVRLNLLHLESLETYEEIFLRLEKCKNVSPALLSTLLRAVVQALETIPATTNSRLVHDDFWPKNILTDNHNKTYILDWDNANIASPAYDLSFVTRAYAASQLNNRQISDFEEGYGETVPDLELANAYGTLHRARWLCSLIERMHCDDVKATELFVEESPLWSEKSTPYLALKDYSSLNFSNI